MTNTSLKDVLQDVLKHTHSLGIFEMVKIEGTTSETNIETVDAEKTVIVKAKTHSPVADFAERTVGINRMSVLDGYLKYPEFNEEGATVSLLVEEKNGQDVVEEIVFVDKFGTKSNYRFMPVDIVNQKLKEIKFRGAEFDMEIVPTQKNLKDLQYFNSVLSTFESTFSPRTEDGKLYFYIGDTGGDRTKILVNDAPGAEFSNQFQWPLDTVLKILRLAKSSDIVLSLNKKGLLQIKIDSGLGEYTYLLPAKG